ncbi:MAG TPA: Rieske 2Fe-2S domain-containing protein [Chloroflexota bacterium]|nr:Rieske 2Fe-2S domain-containing protein [Chloroflexota bacterium]
MGVAYVPVGKPDEIEEGKMKSADLGGRRVLVTAVNGEFFAFSSQCPHEGTDLDTGEINGKRIVCEAHNYWFDLGSGECLMPKGGPALAVLPLELRDGELCVRLEW